MFKVLVTRKVEIAEGVFLFDFTATDSAALPTWSPGAHVDVILPSGQARQYSLVGDRQDATTYTIAVLRDQDGRGGSKELCDRVSAGDVLDLDGPRNRFELRESRSYLFIAGGIGITPLKAMIDELVERGHHSWKLLYGGRTRASMAFAPHLSQHGSLVALHPQDELGLLDLEMLVELDDDVAVYCCGPTPLLDAVREKLADRSGNFFFERFAPGDAVTTTGDQEFTLVLQASGVETVVPADKSILDVIKEHVPTYPSSCQDGTCGTCETAVLGGIPDHRDWVLSDEEKAVNDCMMVCVGRSLSPTLTLDA